MLAGLGVYHVIGQRQNLVAVDRKRVVGVPRELAPRITITQSQLDTAVVHVARLNGQRRRTRTRGDRRLESLIGGLRVVIRYVEVEVAQETHRQTDLERLRAFGLEIVDREPGLRTPVQAALAPREQRIGQITLESDTYRCIRCTDLDVGEILRHLGNDLRQHDRSTYRRIEERALLRVGPASCDGQSLRPVSVRK